MIMFQTKYQYYDRKSKAFYVFDKYSSILKGKILDVGADQCYLKKYQNECFSHIGIGLGSTVDKVVDLEKEKIPFKNNFFDCVLCFDVLEHLDNIHVVFDELCRVSKKNVIISLPNPYNSFFNYLVNSDYASNQHLKYYGLPFEKPDDRHKWFFSTDEAIRFVKYKAKKNNMKIVQIDYEGNEHLHFSIKKMITKLLFPKLSKIISNKNLHTGSLWIVLEKQND